MPCDKYLELLSARLDGELTQQEHTDLTDHLAACPACRAAADQLDALHAALGDLEVPVPEHLTDSVLHSIQTEKRSARRRALRRWGSLAACLVLCLGLYALSGAPGQDVPDANAPVTARTIDPQTQPFAVVQANASLSFSDPMTTSVTWGSTPDTPCAVVLGSVDSLAAFATQFPDDDLSALAEVYDVDFFRSHRLLAVVVDASSGSTVHTLAPDGLTYDSVAIARSTPQVFTCDMAAWLLTARVGADFADGQRLSVVFTD